jgi:hypothetical protein
LRTNLVGVGCGMMATWPRSGTMTGTMTGTLLPIPLCAF